MQVNLSPDEKVKYSHMLNLLEKSRVDCRQFVNLKIVFLNEDQKGNGVLNEEQFRHAFRKSLKKCEMQ